MVVLGIGTYNRSINKITFGKSKIIYINKQEEMEQSE